MLPFVPLVLVLLQFTPLPRTSFPIASCSRPAQTPLVMLFGFGKKAKDEAVAAKSTATAVAVVEPPAAPTLVAKADALHAAKQVTELFALLEDADASDDELAWRIARAHHDMAEESVGDQARREKLLRDGLAIAKASKERCNSGLALKWYAILLGRLGDFLPKEEKIANSFIVKDSLEGAAARLPEDASVQTALGQWCFKVAGISWIERNIAKALFGTPPESTYDEALRYFVASDAIRPSKKASFFAGQACAKLKRADEAKTWYKRCLELPSSGEADAELDQQARAELK